MVSLHLLSLIQGFFLHREVFLSPWGTALPTLQAYISGGLKIRALYPRATGTRDLPLANIPLDHDESLDRVLPWQFIKFTAEESSHSFLVTEL